MDKPEHAMFKTVLREVEGEVVLVLPEPILDALHLQAGSPVELAVDGDRLIVRPSPKPKYTLEELLSRCSPCAELSAEDREWLDAKPVGREL